MKGREGERGGMDVVCMCVNFVACSCCDGRMCVYSVYGCGGGGEVCGVVSVDLRTRQFFFLSRFVGVFVENGN